jgi:hypothetical protein
MNFKQTFELLALSFEKKKLDHESIKEYFNLFDMLGEYERLTNAD